MRSKQAKTFRFASRRTVRNKIRPQMSCGDRKDYQKRERLSGRDTYLVEKTVRNRMEWQQDACGV